MSTDVAKTAANTAVQKTEALSYSERFTAMVVKEFSSNAGELNLTSFQRKLIQNYFIKLDQVLKEAEKKRLAKDEKYRDPLPFTWENVNNQKLATDVVAFSSIGLDPLQPNHINLIPFKNNSTGKYDIVFMIGYRGAELKVKKYGFEVPDDILIELVYTNDHFKSIKKSVSNPVESYEFEVKDDFDRGELRGGFYYFAYNDEPRKNKLRVMSMKDIEKRIPGHASVEFWGGEKDKWENGKRAGKEQVEGWKDEMAWKTVARAAYNAITIDSEKIDEHLLAMLQAENERLPEPEDNVKNQITARANKSTLTFEDAESVDVTNIKQQLPAATNIETEQKEVQELTKQPIQHSKEFEQARQPKKPADGELQF